MMLIMMQFGRVSAGEGGGAGVGGVVGVCVELEGGGTGGLGG